MLLMAEGGCSSKGGARVCFLHNEEEEEELKIIKVYTLYPYTFDRFFILKVITLQSKYFY